MQLSLELKEEHPDNGLSWSYRDERKEWCYGDAEDGDGAVMFWEEYGDGIPARWRILVYTNGKARGWVRAESQDLDEAKREVERIIERCTTYEW